VAGTRTIRSTISTALRPEAAARACSQARCRQVAEHHFGIGPRDRGVIARWHQPHVVAAARRNADLEPSTAVTPSSGGCRSVDRSRC
jgi:hypothetical protein